MNHLKTYKLFEHPDFITTRQSREIFQKELFHYDFDTVTFGYKSPNKNSKMVTGRFGIVHSDLGKSRFTMKYPGRLWINSKVITFWQYPNKDQLKKVIQDIQDSYNNNGFKVRLPIRKSRSQKNYVAVIRNDEYNIRIEGDRLFCYRKTNTNDTEYEIVEVNDTKKGVKPLIERLKNPEDNVVQWLTLTIKSREKLKITEDWWIEIRTKYTDVEDFKKIKQDRMWDDDVDYVKLKDYVGSLDASEEEMKIPHLMNWKEKQALKAKGWGKGFGSDMTAWDSKNPLAWRQAKYQENSNNVKSFKLFESPNWVENFLTKDGDYVDFHFEEGFAFGFYNGDFCVSDYTHEECLYDWLKEKGWYNLPTPDIDDEESLKEFHEQYPDVPIEKIVDYEAQSGRADLAGRYFPQYKLITFWKFPKDNEELHEVVNAIEDYLNKDIWDDDEWKVEVLVNEEAEMRDGYWWERGAEVEFIPLKEYKGGPQKHWQDEVNPHLLNWKEKQELKKKGFGKGFGSDLTAWDSKNPLAWRQAKYQESVMTDFENFSEGIFGSSIDVKKYLTEDGRTLNISNLGLRHLPRIPETVINLDCSKNNLSGKLTGLPKGLQSLDCSNNHITEIPYLPNLSILDCSFNNISNLEIPAKNMISLYAIGNKLPFSGLKSYREWSERSDFWKNGSSK